MSAAIPGAAKARIINHMNEDHADACLAYVRHFGKQPRACAARLVDVFPEHMVLRFEAEELPGEQDIKIAFPAPLASAEDAHHTLVSMAIAAREALAAEGTA